MWFFSTIPVIKEDFFETVLAPISLKFVVSVALKQKHNSNVLNMIRLTMS